MAKKNQKCAISPTRQEDYPQWYQNVVKEADLAEMAHVRGCMVIKPWGYAIWEQIQKHLDAKFKATGHENAYFPVFIPLSYIEKEASHVKGFAKEMAVVTHHRVQEKEGKLVPAAPLEEALIIRPTSETIIGESFAQWIKSYRDLPMLINQWANVVRWEMRPRVFLRTTEFLWQEGHTAHSTEKEALEETMTMLEVYRSFAEDFLALPVIVGEKPANERFPGAEKTFCIEAMMQDRKALQAGTSHYLGQNFARAAGIKFLNKSGTEEHAYTTSWGVSTRLIGALIMAHADDNGLRLPPKIAPKQVVIVPMLKEDGSDEKVMQHCKNLSQNLLSQGISVFLDTRDARSVEKKWKWIKKGVPIILEIGARDVSSEQVTFLCRNKADMTSSSMSTENFTRDVGAMLEEIQRDYFNQAKKFMEENIKKNIQDFAEFKEWFSDENDPSKGGFVLAKWSEDPETIARLEELKVTIRCMPLTQSGTSGKCVISGKDAKVDVLFAKAY